MFTAVTVDMIFVSIVLQATKVIAAVIASVTVIVIVIALFLSACALVFELVFVQARLSIL